MDTKHTRLLLATAAGVVIAGAAAFAVGPVRADEVAVDDLIIVCPSELQLKKLILREYASGCSLAFWGEVEHSLLRGSVFGNTYDAWFLGIVDEPWETVEQVSCYTVKIVGYKAHVATEPLTFLDEHWLDEDDYAENTIQFGLQYEQFEEWKVTPVSLPPVVVAVASVELN